MKGNLGHKVLVLLIVGVGGFSSTFVARAAAPVQLEALVDRAVATTSEAITYTVRLRVAEQYKSLSLPEMGDGIAGLRVEEFGSSPFVEDPLGRGFVATRWYKLRADISGSYILPRVSLSYPGEGKEERVSTGEIFLEITAPAAAANAAAGEPPSIATDIREIKDIVALPGRPWWLYALGAGLLGALLGGAWWYRRYRTRQSEVEAPLIPLDAAQESLAALRASELLAQGRHKEFHFILSAALRLFLERQFSFPATDRTIEEISRDLPGVTGLSDAQQREFISILSAGELVKFSDMVLAPERSLSLLDEAAALIAKSVPSLETQDSVI
jgi:hypothetical protein